MSRPDATRPVRAIDDGARVLALAAEGSAVVVVAMALLARLHGASDGPTPLPWERPLSSLSPEAASTARAAIAALGDVERGVAMGAPAEVAQLKDDLVPPFSDPAFAFRRIVDGDVTGYVGRGAADAPFAALLLVVQPTTAPASGTQDEEHHRVVDAAGAPHWLHGSVWFVPAGQPTPRDGVAAPVALGYLRARSQ